MILSAQTSRAASSASSVPFPVRFLIEAGSAAPSADNSQPWRFAWGTTLDLLYRQPDAQQAYLPAGHPATQLALGAVIENLAQASAAIGIPFDAVDERPDGNEAVLRLAVPTDASVEPEASTHPLFRRHTNRFPFGLEPIPDAMHEWLVEQREPPARCVVLAQRDQIEAMALLVRHASEVRFQTREIHEWLGCSLRFTPEEARRGDGLDLATLHLPPGGRQLLRFIQDWKRMSLINRVGAYKALARTEAAPVARAPLLLAILAPMGTLATIAGGRLMERVWIELNRNGIAVQPYFVITDQLYRLQQGTVPPGLVALVERTKLGLDRLLGTNKEQMLILLRLGWPKVDPPRSVRLPLAAVLSDALIE
jgi:hypothetical protein